MTATDVRFGGEARARLLRGANVMADAVKATLGPKRRNVLIRKGFGGPRISKDGVTVAKSIELIDPIENMGAQALREIASRTSELAGDGTTTATVLGQAIMPSAVMYFYSGQPMHFCSGVDRLPHPRRAPTVSARGSEDDW